MHNEPVQIELYTDKNGNMDLLDDMPIKDQRKFVQKNEDFTKRTLQQFLRSKDINPIVGFKNYYEIKYWFSSPPYRGISIIRKQLVVILSVFKGSGSGGALKKYISKAINRAQDWLSRNQQP